MNMYRSMKKSFQQEYKTRSPAYKARLTKWNSEGTVTKVDKPTNIARARELGYKAKQGVVIVRVRVGKGRSKRPKPAGGRTPSKMGMFFSYNKSMQSIAEERASRKFSNCEVLNSYFVGATGDKKFYEVILLDRARPEMKSDPIFKSVVKKRGRANRALTFAGRKHRGMAKKGTGSFKARPSKRSRTRY